MCQMVVSTGSPGGIRKPNSSITLDFQGELIALYGKAGTVEIQTLLARRDLEEQGV